MSNSVAIIEKYQLDITVGERGVERQGVVLSPKAALKLLSAAQNDQLKTTLEKKKIHGVFYSQCQMQGWDTKTSHGWLTDERLFGRTEGLIVAAQDGVIYTRAYLVRVQKRLISPICRKCHKANETLGHILSRCEKSLWTLIKERHDRVLYQVVLAFARQYSIKLPEWMTWGYDGWAGVGELKNDKVKLVVDVSIPTESILTERRPDLILHHSPSRRAFTIEVACAWEPLILEREAEKRDKYQRFAADLASQLRC